VCGGCDRRKDNPVNQETVRRLANLLAVVRRTNSCRLTLPVSGNTRTESRCGLYGGRSPGAPSGSGSPGLTTIHGYSGTGTR
jgi:hypothetical protein